MINFGMKLKEVRLKKKVNQYSLAIKTGVSQGKISKLESGRLKPTLSDALRICAALKLPITYFVPLNPKGN